MKDFDFPADPLAARFLAAQAIAREAGLLGMRLLANPEELDVQQKGHQDFVSAADRALETLIAERLKVAFPKDGFYGEETSGGSVAPLASMLWVVDPIDGTANFVRSGSEWCVSIALLQLGKPVIGVIYHPPSDHLYTARQGQGATRDGLPITVSGRTSLQSATIGIDHYAGAAANDHVHHIRSVLERGGEYRRNNCCTLSFTQIAEGRLDAFVELHLNAWDVAAGIVLVREAGGWTSEFFEGSELPRNKALFAATPGLKGDFLAALGLNESGANL
jgi:myo-inositol-1(or 4)-monophosphatase